ERELPCSRFNKSSVLLSQRRTLTRRDIRSELSCVLRPSRPAQSAIATSQVLAIHAWCRYTSHVICKILFFKNRRRVSRSNRFWTTSTTRMVELTFFSTISCGTCLLGSKHQDRFEQAKAEYRIVPRTNRQNAI